MAEHPNRSQEANGTENISEDTVFTWASFCHFSAFFGLLVWLPTSTIWIPIGHLLGPLLAWAWKRHTSPFIDEAGREALNFQIAMSAYGIVVFALFYYFLLSYAILALVVVDMTTVVTAGVRSSRGESYRYPLILFRLLKSTGPQRPQNGVGK